MGQGFFSIKKKIFIEITNFFQISQYRKILW